MRKGRMMKFALLALASLSVCAFISGPFDRVSADHTPPTVTLSVTAPSGENGWHNQPVFVKVKALDGGSGVKIAQVSIGGQNWYPDAMRIALDGEFMVVAQAVDRAGNRARATQIVKIDMTPPEALLKVPEPEGDNGYYVDIVPVVITGKDALSGVVDAGIEADGASRINGTNASQATARLTITESGSYSIHGYVKDQAGNVTTVEKTLDVDLEAPMVEIDTPMKFKGDIPLSGFVQDGVSGIRSIFVDYGAGWSAVDLNETQWSATWPAGDLEDGEYTIYAKAEDYAGNENLIAYQAPILNTLWPFFAIFSLLIAVAVSNVIDPRKKEYVRLTEQIQQHKRMYQNILRLGLDKEISND